MKITTTLVNSKKYIGLLILLGGVLMSLSGLPVLAQSTVEAEVEFFIATPDPNPVPGTNPAFTVGDQITLRLEIIHPADSRVLLPQVEGEGWERFTVVDQTAPETVDNGDGSAVTRRDIMVSLFQPGTYQTPPIVVTHRKPDGTIEELAAPIIQIDIRSILVEGDTDLRDLKGQIDLPEPAAWPWIVAGLLATMLLAGLLFLLLLWLYRRRQAGEAMEAIPVPIFDPRPPEVIAHAELDRIEALNLPAQRQIKEYYTLVSNCLRNYIEGRYRIPAMEQTTYELRTAFRRKQVAPNDSIGLLKLVTQSDYVKFARYQPREEEIKNLINKARAVVDATTVSARAREIPTASPPASSPPAPPSMEPKEVQA